MSKNSRKIVAISTLAATALLMAACSSSGSSNASAGSSPTASSASAAGATGTVQASSSPDANGYPTKPIKIVVPFAAGAAVDVQARFIAKELSAEKGWHVVVDDVPGASGQLAIDALDSAPADGYTLLFGTRSFAFDLLENGAKESVSDFVPVAETSYQAAGFAVNASSPYKTLADFVKAAKASPGKLTVAGPGALDIERAIEYEFANQAGIQLTWVPFSGGSHVVANVLSGAVTAGFAGASNFLSGVQAGKLRYLGLTAAPPYKPLPNYPTFKGQGFDIDESVWYGFVGKKGTSQAVANAFAAAIQGVTSSSAWSDFANKVSLATQYQGPSGFQQLINSQLQTDKPIVKKIESIAGTK